MKRFVILAVLLLSLAQGARCQGARFDSVAQKNVQGFLAPIGGATITVCTAAATGTPCAPLVPTSPVTLCTDATCSTAAPNPFLADGNGNFGFWALASGTYKVSITAPGVTGQLLTVVTPIVGGGAGTFTSLTASSINNVQLCDQFAGATADLKIAACIAALPAAGGVADARGIIGAQSFASTLAINKSVLLWLGNVRITGPASGDVIQVSAPGVIIRGSGSQGSIAATQGTVIIAQTAAQADGIHFLTTSSGNQQYRVEDLTLNDSTAGGTARTAGVGFHVDATTGGLNSVGQAQNLWISYFFYDMQIVRPITSIFTHIQANNAKRDGIDFQGDGTSTWCVQCYANNNGRYNHSFWGMSYSGENGGASDHAQQDGYHIDDCQNDGITCASGNSQSIAMTIIGGAEVDCQAAVSTCAGIKAVDTIGLNITSKVLNSKGQGIYINGARAVVIQGTNITGSTNSDIFADCSPTPQCANGLDVNNTVFSTLGGGQITGTSNLFRGYNGTTSVFNILMPMEYAETNVVPTPSSGNDWCYADSTLHMLKCANNGNGFLPVPQTFNTAGTHSDSGLYQTAGASGCTTAASIGGVCATPITITWPGSFSDTNYKVTCTPVGAPTNLPSNPFVVTPSNGSVTVNYYAITAAAASWPTVNCEAVHN